MIDPDLLDTLDQTQRDSFENALITVVGSGLIAKQLEREYERIVTGQVSEPPDELATKILEYRAKTAGLRAIQLEGLRLIEKKRNER